jgi:type III pantothenate kinase
VSGPIVVDVGNSRIKWGRCERGTVVEVAALPADAPEAWQAQFDAWPVAPVAAWVVSGVHPGRRDALVTWLRRRTAELTILDSYRQLPLEVRVDAPESVGIDRLLNAVAVNTRRPPGSAAVVVDAGSAVTVDLVDEVGAFRGGAIFPGLRLMAQALHEHTAQLPMVDFDRGEPPPGMTTAHAIRVGVFHAVLGGIRAIASSYSGGRRPLSAYITGGDASTLVAWDTTLGEAWPAMTLEGVLHSVPKASTHG